MSPLLFLLFLPLLAPGNGVQETDDPCSDDNIRGSAVHGSSSLASAEYLLLTVRRYSQKFRSSNLKLTAADHVTGKRKELDKNGQEREEDFVISELPVWSNRKEMVRIPLFAWVMGIGYKLENVTHLKLTSAQLKDIFSGRVRSWMLKDLMADNLQLKRSLCDSIVVMQEDKDSDLARLFAAALLCNRSAGPKDLGGTTSYYAHVYKAMSSLVLSFNCSIGYVPVPLTEPALPLSLVNGVTAAAATFSPEADTTDWLFCSKPNSYPLIFLTRLVAPQDVEDCSVVRTISNFVRFILKDTQLPSSFIRLPEAMMKQSLMMAANMTCNRIPIGNCEVEKNITTTTPKPPESKSWSWQQVVIPVAASMAGLVLFTLVGACIYRSVRIAQIVRRAEWLIPIEEIAFEFVPKAGHVPRNRAAPSVSGLSFTPSSADSGRGSANEDGDDVTGELGDDLEVPVERVLRWPGRFRGNLVSLRLFKRGIPRARLSTENKMALVKLRDSIRHDNLVRFCGLTALEDEFLIVNEFCHRGSLHAAIFKRTTRFREEVKAAIAFDIASAMAYLHSENLVHGTLSSQCCFLDSKWTVKIADWELKRLEHVLRFCKSGGVRNQRRRPFVLRMKEAILGLSPEEARSPSTWDFRAAPELIRSNFRAPLNEATDVYAFAFLIFELFCEAEPFADLCQALSPSGVLEAVSSRRLRPHCPRPIDRQALQVMEACWAENAASRPRFESLKKLLDKAFPRRKQMLESMVKNFEQYSQLLERQVTEKELELQERSNRCNAFIRQALPASLAEPLISCQSATPSLKRRVGIAVIQLRLCSKEQDAVTRSLKSFSNLLRAQCNSPGSDLFLLNVLADQQVLFCGLSRRSTGRNVTELASAALQLSGEAHRSGLSLSCALHCGPLLNGIVGSGGPLFAAFGPAVHVAMEMSEGTKPGTILASQDVVRTLMQQGGDRFSAQEMKPVCKRAQLLNIALFELRERSETGGELSAHAVPKRNSSLSTNDLSSEEEPAGRQGEANSKQSRAALAKAKAEASQRSKLGDRLFAAKRRAFLSIPDALSGVRYLGEAKTKAKAFEEPRGGSISRWKKGKSPKKDVMPVNV